MRIAFISGMDGSPWGGSEVLWSRAAKCLLQQGHDVFASVTGWAETPAPVEQLRDLGASVNERPWKRPSLAARVVARLGLPQRGSGWREILSFGPDLVCVSRGSTLCGTEWMELCRAEGISYVSLAQANFEQWWPDDIRAGAIIRAYEGAKRAYFVSRANLLLFERQLGIHLPNGEVVWNPFNVSWEASPIWPAETGTLRLACVARLDPGAKGQDLLFQVLAKPKWRDRPVNVSLFGAGRWEQSLRRLSGLLGVTEQIDFAGHVGDIEAIWRTHHCLIMPSRYEGLPLSLVEAMLCGRPSIITDVAGNAEPLEDSVTGFIAAAPTVQHLDEAMERAWQRRNDWPTIGAAAAAGIRRQVPQDPAQAFADKLLSLCV